MQKLTTMEILALSTWDPQEIPELVKSAIGKLLSNYQQDRQRQASESFEDYVTERLAREVR
jgi:hypothetical protein